MLLSNQIWFLLCYSRESAFTHEHPLHFTVTMGVSLLPWLAIKQCRWSLHCLVLLLQLLKSCCLFLSLGLEGKASAEDNWCYSIFKARNSFVLTQVMRLYSHFLCPQDCHSSTWKGSPAKDINRKGKGGRCGRKKRRKHKWYLSGQDKIARNVKSWRHLPFIQKCVTETSGFLLNVHVGLIPFTGNLVNCN